MIESERYGTLRKHQARAEELGDRIVAGMITHRHLTASVVPAGGKTLMAAIIADILFRAGLIDEVQYVVPNLSLLAQAKRKFRDIDRGITWMLADDFPSGVQGTFEKLGRHVGRPITYQKLANARHAKKAASRARDKRTLVVFDECHHLCVDDELSADDRSEVVQWIAGAKALGDAASFVLSMSGTLHRADGKRVPFVRYDESAEGDHKPAIVDIKYTRAEALEERAILRTDFKMFDGRSEYAELGTVYCDELSTVTGPRAAKSLKTLLSQRSPGGYVDRFVDAALQHWEQYVTSTGHESAAIVVCHSQKAAKDVFKLVQARFGSHTCGIAISDQSNSKSKAAIDGLTNGRIRILVTVKKAYEGLDVPHLTHLLYLHDTRNSYGFLDQVLGRPARVDLKCHLTWEQQSAFVFCPNDGPMREYVAKMLFEQAVYFDSRVKEGEPRGPVHRASTFTPLSGELTKVSSASDGRLSTPEEDAAIAELERAEPAVVTWPTERKLRLIRIGQRTALTVGMVANG